MINNVSCSTTCPVSRTLLITLCMTILLSTGWCITPGILSRAATLGPGEYGGGFYLGAYGIGIQGRLGITDTLEIGSLYAEGTQYNLAVLDAKLRLKDNISLDLIATTILAEGSTIGELDAIFTPDDGFSRIYYGAGITVPNITSGSVLNVTLNSPSPKFFAGWAPQLSDRFALCIELDCILLSLIPSGSIGITYKL